MPNITEIEMLGHRLDDKLIASLKEHYDGDYNIQCIGMLRQWLNEERIPQGKSVTTRELERWLRPLIEKL